MRQALFCFLSDEKVDKRERTERCPSGAFAERRKRGGVLLCAVREAGIPPAVRARILAETSSATAPRGEPSRTASDRNLIGGEVNRKGVISTVWSHDH